MAATNQTWILCYWHHPPYSKGSHDSDDPSNVEMFDMRQNVLPILDSTGVDLVMCGHSHDYERYAPQNANGGLDNTRGVRQFVVGTGGAFFTGMGAIDPSSGRTVITVINDATNEIVRQIPAAELLEIAHSLGALGFLINAHV